MKIKVSLQFEIDTKLFKKQRAYLESLIAKDKCDELVGLSHITDFIADTIVDDYGVSEDEVMLLDVER